MLFPLTLYTVPPSSAPEYFTQLVLSELTIFLDVAVADAKIINERGTQLYKKKKIGVYETVGKG